MQSKNLDHLGHKDRLVGQKWANAACVKVSTELGIPLKDVQARYKRSRLLTRLLTEDGPGTLCNWVLA